MKHGLDGTVFMETDPEAVQRSTVYVMKNLTNNPRPLSFEFLVEDQMTSLLTSRSE